MPWWLCDLLKRLVDFNDSQIVKLGVDAIGVAGLASVETCDPAYRRTDPLACVLGMVLVIEILRFLGGRDIHRTAPRRSATRSHYRG